MFLFVNFPSWLRPEIIPRLPFRWYGLMYIAAFATAYLVFSWQIKEEKGTLKSEDKDLISNFFFWAILGLILGARLGFALILDKTGYYWRHPFEIFWPFQNGKFIGLQGMSYFGGVVGGAIGGITFMRLKKISVWKWGDYLGAAIPLGFTFGRLGNFINGELYGRVSTGPFGMIFPAAEKFSTELGWVQDTAAKIGMDLTGLLEVNLPRYPSQIYEALLEGVILWAILWFLLRKRKPFDGAVLAAYFTGYGFFRFFMEYLREPVHGTGYVLTLSSKPAYHYLLNTPWNFTTYQVLSLLMVVAGIGLFFWAKAADKKKKEQVSPQKAKKVDYRKLRKKIK